MEAFGYNSNSDTVSLGETSHAETIRRLHQCAENTAVQYRWDEEKRAATSFRINRNKDDQLAIEALSETDILISSDRLHPPARLIDRLNKKHFTIKCFLIEAEEILTDYWTMDRPEFERKYEQYLSE